MPSTAPLDISTGYAAASPGAQDKVPASTLDADHAKIEAWSAAFTAAVGKVIRSDDTLVDEIVRLRNLHPEVIEALEGLTVLAVATVCSTGNQAALSGLLTIDGYTLIAGDRVILVGQSNGVENGVWVASAGAWSRPSDFASGSSQPVNIVIDVLNGTVQSGSTWRLSGATTVDSSAQVWSQLSGLSSIIPLTRGGTGASTAAAARANLGSTATGDALFTAASAAAARSTIGGLTKVVDNLAALKALSGTDLSGTVLMQGWTSVGDGGGGIFRWAAGDASTANDGTIVAPTAGGGRFRRIFTDQVNVRWFGAVGDGVVDDTVAVQSACTASNNVLVPIGTFIISSQLIVTGHISGEGWGSILKQGASDNQMIDLRTGDTAVRNLTLMGATTNTDTFKYAITCAFATLPESILIDRVQIKGSSDATGFTGGIYLVGAQGAKIQRCRIRNIRGVNSANAIFLEGYKPVALQNIASASPLSLPATGNLFRVTGATGFSAVSEGSNTSSVITLAFAGSLTMTHGANLSLLNAFNITTEAEAAGSYPHDYIILQKVSAGIWRQIPYHLHTCNFCEVTNNDIEFTTGATDAERFGYTGIVLRNGGTGNVVADNRIRYGNQVQISIVSTTEFLDKNRGVIVRNNRLYDLLGPAVSAHGYQESAIELGGRSEECIIDGNYIRRPFRYGIWFSEDGTYLSNGYNLVRGNIIVESYLNGISVLGIHRAIISENIIRDAGVNSANTQDGIFIQPQPVGAALEAIDLQVNNNIIYGPTWTRYGIHIYNPSALQATRISLRGNQIKTVSASIVDTGNATRRIGQVSNTRFPFTNQLSGYKTFADNTATAFLRLTIPNKKCAGLLVIKYVINSNQILRVSTGEYRIPFGRFAGQDSAAAGTDTEALALALNGGSEAHTTKTLSVSAVSGGPTATQTFDVSLLLDSDSNLATNIHFLAEILSDGYIADDETAEPSISAL